ncbi:MAG: PucC family protein, partial [Microcystaceae cyanobacterium]
RGLATVFGGLVLNAGKALFPESVWAYSSVFVLQAMGLILAVGLLTRVNVREFQTSAKAAIATVLEGDLES